MKEFDRAVKINNFLNKKNYDFRKALKISQNWIHPTPIM